MSSSTEARRLRGSASSTAAQLVMPELRPATWTRLGDESVKGDDVTEQLLGGLAERTRAAARAQGYASGWAEGRREGEAAGRGALEEEARRAAASEERRSAEHETTVTALRATAGRLDEAVAEVTRAVEERAVTLALELTRELVGRAAPEATEHALRRAVSLLPEHPVVAMRVHPEAAGSAREMLAGYGVEVVADDDLGPADVVAEAADHVLDLRLGTALERLREVLS